MDFIGLLIGLAILCGLALLAGGVFAALVWFLFWGRHRPRRLILFAGLIPISTLVYVVFCAICMEIFVPNQPDLFFGDFAEPLPHGYILTGLGKMPEFAYFESTPPMVHQPPLLGGVRRLEQDGEIVYGAYGHREDLPYESEGQDHGYFVFDTRTGLVRNLNTLEELNTTAGHSVHLVESEYFRSQDPHRILLQRFEDLIFFAPPVAAMLLCVFVLLRQRLKKELAAPPLSRP